MKSEEIKDLKEYMEKVFKYLDYIHYPELVIEYEPSHVAASIGLTILDCFMHGNSHYACCIVIFSCTMNQQIIPDAKSQIKH